MTVLNVARLMTVGLFVSMIPASISEGARHYCIFLSNFGGKFISEVFDWPPAFRRFGLG